MSVSPDNGTAIAYQGMPGANSHIACRQRFPEMAPLPCDSFEDAFAAVTDGAASLAMIPIENSLGGRVADIHHLLPESALNIVGEHFLSVEYDLVAPKGATLEGLREVRSHIQALAQCREQIQGLGIEPVAHADTAGAAKEVAELGDPRVAAVSPPLAAEIYGLDVLRKRFEDRIGNTTRFVVLARSRQDPDPHDGPCMTAIVFQTRSVPASLYKALGGFATNGINITKLESYVSGARFEVARFYAEIEGHPADAAVARAMEDLNFYSTDVRVLGAFPADDFRNQS